MASRDINQLHPLIKSLYLEFDKRLKAENINYVVCCTYRSPVEQNELYALGRTKPGRIVTNAKGGESAHNNFEGIHPCALAFDIAIFSNGKYAADNDPQWCKAGLIGQQVGLDWAGAPNFPFHELAHYQLKNWRHYVGSTK